MVGAHMIALPFYQLVVKRIYNEGRGVALSGDKFGLPAIANPVDVKVWLHTHTHTHAHEYTRISMCIKAGIANDVDVKVWMPVCIHKCVCVFMCVCVYVRVCI